MGVTPKKEAVVAEIKEQLSSAKGAVFTSYKGLTVAQDTKLRREMREAGITYKVIKNTMTRIAANDLGLDGISEHLEGTTALAFSTEDPVAPAKVICAFMKKNKLEEKGILTIKVGLVEGKVISDKEVKALAALPSREELIAKLLGSMNAPITNTVGVLQGVIRNAVYVLDAIRAQKESA
ncbi:MAG TPA: 50S ribosomal protein L10 [Selenomonas sp.]|nr:50S ribosomal protein L10 [Selenomonadaceae bacterium]HCB92612.1 50S ribosomal protein L10 [Selenomonas sp.]